MDKMYQLRLTNICKGRASLEHRKLPDYMGFYEDIIRRSVSIRIALMKGWYAVCTKKAGHQRFPYEVSFYMESDDGDEMKSSKSFCSIKDMLRELDEDWGLAGKHLVVVEEDDLEDVGYAKREIVH